MDQELSVLLVDDHEIVRAGFAELLTADRGISSIGQVSTGEEALAYIHNNPVDVVVMDVNMDGMDGIKTTALIKQQMPAIRIIMLSIHESEPFITRSIVAGASAFLSKRCAADELSLAIREVLEGNIYLSNTVSRKLALGEINQEQKKLAKLTAREYELFMLLVKGKSMNDIADTLGISPKTGYVHREKIFKKLDVENIIELAAMARRLEVI